MFCVLCHKQGNWNGILSNMVRGTSFTKFGKRLTGIIEKTTDPRRMKISGKASIDAVKCFKI